MSDQPAYKPWVLDAAIEVARHFEQVCIPRGYHIAIGGSVLHRGESQKDLDIFVYPHSTEQCFRRDCMSDLETAGVAWLNDGCKHYHDDKLVVSGVYQDHRIDFFFLL